MKISFFIGFLLLHGLLFSQNRLIPMHTFYKNSFIQYSKNQSIETFFPASANQLALFDSIQDSSVQYFDFHQWLYKKHWLELKHKDYSIHVSPIVNFSFGKAYSNQDSLLLYRNTRGVFIEGQFFSNWSYQFMFTENQSRFLA